MVDPGIEGRNSGEKLECTQVVVKGQRPANVIGCRVDSAQMKARTREMVMRGRARWCYSDDRFQGIERIRVLARLELAAPCVIQSRDSIFLP